MIEINFLSKQNFKLSQQQERDNKIFKYSLSFFSVAAVVFIIVFLANLYLGHRLRQVEAQVTTAKRQID